MLSAGGHAVVAGATGSDHPLVIHHWYGLPNLSTGMACVTLCILLNIDVGHWLVRRVAALAIAANAFVVNLPNRRERGCVVAIFADRLHGNMVCGEGRLCVLAKMAHRAILA